MAKKREVVPAAPAAAALSSLGDLLRQRGVGVADAPAMPAAPVDAPPPLRPAADFDLSRSAKLVVRRERKGHGGKTATVVAGLNLGPAQLEAAARALRKALGCGAWVDGATIVLQGDRAPAAETWLRARGARQIVRAN